MKPSFAVIVLCLMVPLAGCLDSESPVDPAVIADPPEPIVFGSVMVQESCKTDVMTPAAEVSGCFEPSVVWSQDGLWVTNSNGLEFARSRDGGKTWEILPAPVDPTVGVQKQADVLIQLDPQGRLWWSSLLIPQENVLVARSDDGGDTWGLVRTIGLDPMGASTLDADRQWLTFSPDGRILMTCNCFSHYRGPMFVSWSEDDGETWSASFVTDTVNHVGPPGPPMVLDGGAIVMPMFDGDLTTTYVAVGVSTDDGATFEVIHLPASGHGLLCCAWPSLSQANDGTLWLAWSSQDGPMLSHSDDGHIWSDPVLAVSSPGTVYPHPGIQPYGDDVVLSWFTQDEPVGHRVAYVPAEGNATVWSVSFASSPSSDFGALAVGPDGRVAVPWILDGSEYVALSDGPLTPFLSSGDAP